MKKFPVPHIIFGVFIFFSVVFVAAAQEISTDTHSKSYPFSYYTHPLRIPVLKNINFPGSEIAIEEVLPKGIGYDRYRVSYISDQNKIFGLLAVPKKDAPVGGFPGILMAHGYIPPAEYNGAEAYTELVDVLAQNGYIVFMPDLRGHGNSEGVAEGAYFSPVYTIDFLNAFSSLSRHRGVNPDKIGVWGHSMGGNIVLKSIIVEKRIKSAVIWSGVVGSYADLFYHWSNNTAWSSLGDVDIIKPQVLISQFGSFNDNHRFWQDISPLSYISEITVPIQLDHSINDKIVPLEFSQKLKWMLEREKKPIELNVYQRADHNMEGDESEEIKQKTLHFFSVTLE